MISLAHKKRKAYFAVGNYAKLLLLIILFLFAKNAVAQTNWHNDMPAQPDYRQLISQADLDYRQPVSRSEAGMPIGNGVMGSLVWTSPKAIHFQINRVDVFANNAASNSFYQRSSDYCDGLGFVDIQLPGENFTADNFHEHLSCYDGEITLSGKQLKAELIACRNKDVIALHIDSRGLNKNEAVKISLRMLRPSLVKHDAHNALSNLDSIDENISLKQIFTEGNYYCSSALAAGASVKTEIQVSNDSTITLTAFPRQRAFTIYLASAASFDPHENVDEKANRQLREAEQAGFEKLLDNNKKWWHAFWQKAYIQLHSEDGVADDIEKNYNYYLYIMASCSEGKYPAKFNGMLWNTGGDLRKWGSLYWGANQSCLYNALFATNRLNLLDPMFDMYSGMYAACAVAARQEWGSKGIYIPETVAFDGLAKMPPAIAKEMQALYLLQKPWSKRSDAFKVYVRTKLPYLSRWNWKADGRFVNGEWEVNNKGAGPFGHVTHIFSRGAKIAYQYWLRYAYTMDTAWLRNNAYPIIRGVAEFYRNFPNVRKGKDGLYNIYDVNDNESIWGGHNTIEELSAMRGIFPVLIKASEILDTEAAMRPVWKAFLDHLSPLPTTKDYNHNSKNKISWVRALPPILKGNGDHQPDANTMPPWFFDLCTLESPDSIQEVAKATFDTYFPKGIHTDTKVYVLSKLPVAGALLGDKQSAKYLIDNQIHTAETKVLPNRMDEREGEQTTNVERLGRAAEALQDALCQSVPAAPGENPVIHVFPAWPESWDAHFKLLCRGGFLISAEMKDSLVKYISITSKAGAICRIRNPWKQPVDLWGNGRHIKKLKGNLLVFSTKKGADYLLKTTSVDSH